MPAEWEPQKAVQLTWPHEGTDWAPMLPEITAVYEEMAREIRKREDVLIVAPKELQSELLPLTSHLLPLTSNDTWARDHGFITVEEASALSPQTSSSLTSSSTDGVRNSPLIWTIRLTNSSLTKDW